MSDFEKQRNPRESDDRISAGCYWLESYYFSEDIPNIDEFFCRFDRKLEELREKAQQELDDWLESQGLQRENGVVFRRDGV